jgi:hypothetical protein
MTSTQQMEKCENIKSKLTFCGNKVINLMFVKGAFAFLTKVEESSKRI